MAFVFRAAAEPSPELCAQAEALDPTNPFCTPAYVDALRKQGAAPWLLMVADGDRLLSACAAFLRSGRLNRGLEIVSLPPLEAPAVFWDGLRQWARQQRITQLEVGTFASAGMQSIPALGIEIRRRPRVEYVLDLEDPQLWKRTASNHLRNTKNARKAGVTVRRGSGEEALHAHLSLVIASLARRKERGESVPEKSEQQAFAALVASGAGELFQALLDGEVLSSILVLQAARGGYYQSAGTSPTGMARGASHFLVQEIAESLRSQGKTIFNLGGADQASEGLRRFKAGFGAREVPLEAATFFLGGALKKKMMTAAALLRDDPSQALRRVTGTVERYVVYTALTAAVPPAEELTGIRFEKLSDQTLTGLAAGSPEMREHADRFARLKFNEAYGVWSGDTLAHAAWLIPAERDAAQPVRNVKLRDGEAEITHCVTRSEFRGKGLYPFAIRSLCETARQRGITRIFMITNVRNIASQRGIEKAGLKRCGEIARLTGSSLPVNGLTYRGHRWRALP